MKSVLKLLVVFGVLATSFSSFGQELPQQPASIPPSLPPIAPMSKGAPSEAVALARVVARESAEFQKFAGLSTKARISEVQVVQQNDGGFQLTVTSELCPDAPAASNDTNGGFPFPMIPAACPVFAKLIVDASPDAEQADGFEYRVLFNGTTKKQK